MTTNSLGNPQALAQQIMEAANSLSDQEASQRYQQIVAQLPPDEATKLNALALSQVDHNERRTLASQFRQAKNDPNSPFDDFDDDDDDDRAADPMVLGRMTARAQQQDPALLGGMLGGQQSGIGGQIGKAALAALAAMLIRNMMNGQGAGQSQGLPQQGLPQRGGQQMPSSQGMPGGLDIGSILGGLLGGGGAQGGHSQGLPQRGGQQMPPSQGMPGGLDIGSILGGVLGGGGAQQPQAGDLGSILGSILGGGADDAPPTSPSDRSHRR